AFQYVDHHAVGDFLDGDAIPAEQRASQPGVTEVDNAAFLQPVDQADQAQDTQPAETAHRDAAEQVVPVHEREVEPALVGAACDGYQPADAEFGQVNRDKQHVPEDEVGVDLVTIEREKVGRVLGEECLQAGEGEEPVEHDQRQVQDNQQDHGHVDDVAEGIQIPAQVFAVYLYAHRRASRLTEAGPHRAMVGGTIHGADIVVDAGIDQARQQRARHQDMVDAQAAARIIIKAFRTIVEPAEQVVAFRMQLAPAVGQAETEQAFIPFALLRQEAGLAVAQPALAVAFSDADIDILRRDIEVAHHHHRLVGVMVVDQVLLQVGIEFFLGRKFHRVVAALALREIAVQHDHGFAETVLYLADNHAALGILGVAG